MIHSTLGKYNIEPSQQQFLFGKNILYRIGDASFRRKKTLKLLFEALWNPRGRAVTKHLCITTSFVLLYGGELSR
jgi:hypothetical protein